MKRLSAEAELIMRERLGKDSVIALATEEKGIPYVRCVNAYYEDECFYVITHALSNKMRQICSNPKAATAGEWFSAHGTGTTPGYFRKPENKQTEERLREVFAEWIDNGHNDFSDENTVILCIRLTDGILLSHGRRYEF